MSQFPLELQHQPASQPSRMSTPQSSRKEIRKNAQIQGEAISCSIQLKDLDSTGLDAIMLRRANVLLDGPRRQSAFVGHAHISCERAVWDPLGRSTRCALFKHTINLLKRQALGLRNEEVCVDEASCAERSPDEEHA